MDPGYISAVAALAGSVVGGLTTGFTTWVGLRAQARAGRLRSDFDRHQDLFKDFIVAASKAYGDAIQSNELKIEEIVALYATISRMRVICWPQTVECADEVLRATIDAYSAPNRTVSDIHEMIKSGAGIDPLRNFSEAARRELLSLTYY